MKKSWIVYSKTMYTVYRSPAGWPISINKNKVYKMNWKLNQPTRLRNGSTVLLSIEIQLGEDNCLYFPWTTDGFTSAFEVFSNNIQQIRSTDCEEYGLKIVCDDGSDDGSEYISRKELSQKDYFTFYKFQTGQLQEKVTK